MNISDKLTKLRKLMTAQNLDYYIVPSKDEHNNEYVPDHWQRRRWISDFTGSAGDVVIGMEQAYLWTDPRYFLQAEQQLNSKLFKLMKQQQGTAPIDQWFTNHNKPLKCAIDPKLISLTQADKLQHALSRIDGELKKVDANLIDQIWPDQPPLTNQPIKIYAEKHAGINTTEKLKHLRDAMVQLDAKAHVITLCDAIAWLFNIRGDDIAYNPLVISYAIITLDSATLFVDKAKIRSQDYDYFTEQHITLLEYSEFKNKLNQLQTTVLLDPSTCNLWVKQQLSKATILTASSPINLQKACKNLREQEGMREAHRRDAIAMVKFLYWLEHHWQGQTEISAADQLEVFRREDPDCQGLSFETISAFADHGAIIHYAATEKSNCKIDNNALYLVDSGGQYWQGTTDITRTIHLGNPSDQEKKHYTLVLKGHLALRNSIFPEDTKGEELNVLAHLPLWKKGLDYGHGTGHGVGCYLCVHEGPQRISAATTGIALQEGMVVSNEPGVYFPDQYGIRIENLCLITRIDHSHFHTFEDLTLVPYAQKLIDITLLNSEEVQWINDYHGIIYEELSPHLSDELSDWLKNETKSLSLHSET